MAVYKDNATGTWRVIYRFTNWKGERKQTQKRGFATKREALAWEHEVMLKQGAKLDMTFASFFEIYEADKKQRVKESTWESKSHVIRTKILPYFGKPLIKKIVTVLRSVYRAYLDLSIKFSDMQRSYERAWDKVNSLTVRVDELWNENRTLKERMGDFYLVERALGRDTVETIVLREKRLEEEQRVQRRKQKRKMDRDAR